MAGDEKEVVAAGTAGKSGVPPSSPARRRSICTDRATLFWQLIYAALLAVVSVASAWRVLDTMYGGRSPWHVWWYGWVTALSTGLGALPMLLCKRVSDWYLGMANALAAGMMTAASAALVAEGMEVEMVQEGSFAPGQSVIFGVAVGVAFIVVSQHALKEHSDVQLGILDRVNARKALLIVIVMTVHSFSEGIGIGVSFGGRSAPQLGMLVTATLAVHNVPEGLAISVVLVSRGMSVFGAALWSITTSLPQPVMALASFMAVDSFALVQRAGLGFAAGAMLYVACAELFVDALEIVGLAYTASMALASGCFMWACHEYLT